MNIKKTFQDLTSDIKETSAKVINGIGNTSESIAEKVKDTIESTIQVPKDIQYIKAKNKEIEQIIEDTNKKLDPVRETTNEKLSELAKLKVAIIETTFEEFNQHINSIKNLPIKSDLQNIPSADEFTFSKQEFDDMQVSILSFKNIIKNATGAGVTGAVSAGTIYTAVAALGTASTGTAIGTLSGIAASNATLAWLGGGALAVGGGGIALGTVVLGGIAIVPAVTYLIYKGKFDYSQEREDIDQKYQEVLEYAKSAQQIIKSFTELTRLIDNTIGVLQRFQSGLNQLNKQTEHIRTQIGDNYKKYTQEQQQILQKHIAYALRFHTLMNTPLMREDGSFNPKMIDILRSSNQFLEDFGTIEFVSFKKRVSLWTYLIPVVLIVCISTYGYYIYTH